MPNLIAIRPDFSTTEARLRFRRRASVIPNSGFTKATQHLISGDARKTTAPLSAPLFKIVAKTPAYKIIARLEKKTEIKPVENTSPFANKVIAVILSLLPNYTPDFFRNSIATCTAV